MINCSGSLANLNQEEIEKSIDAPYIKDDAWIIYSKKDDENRTVSSIIKISDLVESHWRTNTYLFEKDVKFANYYINTTLSKNKDYTIISPEGKFLFNIEKNDVKGDVDILFSIFLFIIEGILLLYFLRNFHTLSVKPSSSSSSRKTTLISFAEPIKS